MAQCRRAGVYHEGRIITDFFYRVIGFLSGPTRFVPGASLTTRSDDCFPFCWFLLFQSEAAITVACWARLPLATGRNRRHQYYLVLLGLPSFAPIRQVEPDLIECSIQIYIAPADSSRSYGVIGFCFPQSSTIPGWIGF